MKFNSAIYVGDIMHTRFAPRKHSFSYRSCWYAIDLDELPLLDRSLPLFGHNRASLVGLRDRDYIGGGKISLKQSLVASARTSGIDLDDDCITVFATNLRVAGYVFNPISIAWCWGLAGLGEPDRTREPDAIIVEVHNTFGERHRYVLDPRTAAPGGAEHHMMFEADKSLHVSPFMPMRQRYRFRLAPPGDRFFTRIDLMGSEFPFSAAWMGTRIELTGTSLALSLARYPAVPVATIVRIHAQAARLWRKRIPVYRKPPFVEGVGTLDVAEPQQLEPQS